MYLEIKVEEISNGSIIHYKYSRDDNGSKVFCPDEDGKMDKLRKAIIKIVDQRLDNYSEDGE